MSTTTCDLDTASADADMNVDAVLSRCPDFATETSALQDLVESHGHILVMTPKYSPEVAGVGVEFSFALVKMKYRQVFNDYVPANLLDNVERATSTAVITLAHVRKFARRARDYMRAYADPTAPAAYEMIEKMCKKKKTHRSILDLDAGALVMAI